MNLFSRSGGVLYHWRAWRERSEWRSFSDALVPWLESWKIPFERLILVGPSAGYTLPTAWLARFAEIEAYDLDPLAPLLFQRQHGRLPITFRRQDVFWRGGALSLEASEPLFAGTTPVLFCNVLGQIPLEHHCSEEQWKFFLIQLRSRLAGRPWASYHDLFTIEPLPRRFHQAVPPAGDLEGLRALDYPKITVFDHMLKGNWSRDLERKYFKWSLTNRSLHLIEGVQTL